MPDTPEQIVTRYLERLAEIRSTGGATNETSYYSALERLLNDIGATLRPQVICNGQLRNQGAGHPDFGLYSRQQCARGQPREGQGEIPERGVVEVKGLNDNTWQTASTPQVTAYFDRYHLVLVTNYRDFRLIGADHRGEPAQREFFSLAPDANTFWRAARAPRELVAAQAARFVEFLRRVLLNAAPLTRPEDVAWFLASYARDALEIVQRRDATALNPLREALETALGIHFQGEEGNHFFASTLVQTLFYGLFSGWVVWAHQGNRPPFDWRTAGWALSVPMIRTLFSEIVNPVRLRPLGLTDILDNTARALDRVDRDVFFSTFDTGAAVQHFYEPFLQAFDPRLRKSLGVWYTPPEIVRYMVERVDRALRTELGLANGLADPNVFVLDPCCGTGAFVVEVLRRIERTLRERGEDALIGEDLKQAAQHRVFGFELLSAPFVIAHWQVGNLLAEVGAPLDATAGERPAVYLTNALTGWVPPEGPRAQLPLFPELAVERDAADRVKQNVPILVVLGNPPYNAFAGTSPEEEGDLVDAYKEGLSSVWRIRKYNLDELYVRFLRIGERRITATGRGIVCYISNYSYIDDPSFVVARQRLAGEFDSISIDCLNGDSRETGKLTPDGRPDPSVFSTPFNREGIRLGTAIGLFVRQQPHDADTMPQVQYRDFWGTRKREELIESLDDPERAPSYLPANPNPENRFSFRPSVTSAAYRSWPKVTDLCAEEPISGLQEMRRGRLMAMEREALEQRMRGYFDHAVAWEDAKVDRLGPVENAGGFDAATVRRRVLAGPEGFDASAIRRYALLPLDNRLAYWTATPGIWNRPRPELTRWIDGRARLFVTRMNAERPNENAPALVTRASPDYHLLRPNVIAMPMQLHGDGTGPRDLLSAASDGGTRANLSSAVRAYLAGLQLPDPDEDVATGELIWLHALAICYSPEYLNENEDGVKGDFPRIPLPSSAATLRNSAQLGARLADLLDPDQDIEGVTTGSIASGLRSLGALTRVSRQRGPVDLSVTINWGYPGRDGVIMPGGGRVQELQAWPNAAEMETTLREIAARTDSPLAALGLPISVFLNDDTFWAAVPRAVWEYRIGGYQVVKKWLSYRQHELLGRPLTVEESRHVTNMVRRLAVIVLMTEELNGNYRACRDAH